MFKDRLNQKRKQQGLSAKQMAALLGMELRSYRNYESGDREPSLATLIKIADILDISLDDLLCRDEFMQRHN